MHWNLIARLDYQDISSINEQHSTDSIGHSLEKGSKVKLNFNTIESGEQKSELLWVEILLVQENKYLGQLEDDPKIITSLVRGEMVDFEEQHIYESEYIDPFDPNIKV